MIGPGTHSVLVVDQVEYQIRFVPNGRFEVLRQGFALGAFFGPEHDTPHRVVPRPDATVADMRELYAVAQAFRESARSSTSTER